MGQFASSGGLEHEPADERHPVVERGQGGDELDRVGQAVDREERAAEQEQRVDDEAEHGREPAVVLLGGGEGHDRGEERQAGEDRGRPGEDCQRR